MATTRDSNTERKRSRESVKRTLDRFEMKRSLMRMWEANGGDPDYVMQLRRQTTKLRAELRIKGVIFDDEL
jgi:hypothetical protein